MYRERETFLKFKSQRDRLYDAINKVISEKDTAELKMHEELDRVVNVSKSVCKCPNNFCLAL
jgi:hypothetical protein